MRDVARGAAFSGLFCYEEKGHNHVDIRVNIGERTAARAGRRWSIR